MGRVANRIANAKFTLDNKEYNLAVNNPPNTLHGGWVGFNKVCFVLNMMMLIDKELYFSQESFSLCELKIALTVIVVFVFMFISIIGKVK